MGRECEQEEAGLLPSQAGKQYSSAANKCVHSRHISWMLKTIFTSSCYFLILRLITTSEMQSDSLSLLLFNESYNPYSKQSATKDVQFSCAPRITRDKRKIFVTWADNWQFNTYWDYYQAGKGHLGGESYWLVSMEYVMQHFLDFELVQSLDWVAVRALQEGRAHRYLRMDSLDLSALIRQRMDKVSSHTQRVTCKIREMEWWNRPRQNQFYFDNNQHRFDSRQAISLFEEEGPFATSKGERGRYSKIPFFVHSQITLLPPSEAEARRERRGFILHKGCEWMQEARNRILALLQAGFELHTICSDYTALNGIPSEHVYSLVLHPRLQPLAYSKLLRSMAFVVGLDTPTDSPTPYEGLYNGAAYLNPMRGNVSWTQHRALVRVSPPHVYNYHPKNCTQLVQAAWSAHTHRFTSILLLEHTVGYVKDRVCQQLVESNEVCEAHKHDEAPKLEEIGLVHSLIDFTMEAGVRLIYWAVKQAQRMELALFSKW